MVWLIGERRLVLFPAGTIVRDPHHLESLTRGEQDFNLRITSYQEFSKYKPIVSRLLPRKKKVKSLAVVIIGYFSLSKLVGVKLLLCQ